VVGFRGALIGEGPATHILDQEEIAPGRWRVLMYSTANVSIEPGTVLWLKFDVPANSPDGIIQLSLSKAILAQTTGDRVKPLTLADGALVVVPSPGAFSGMAFGDDGSPRFEFQGSEGRRYTIQASANLVDWIDLQTITVSGGSFNFVDTSAAEYPTRFYRAQLAP
jgi:hypothetical protein